MSLNWYKFGTVASLILLASLSRLLPHPFNFTPLGAIALFGAAHFDRKWLSFVVPTAAMLLSDWLLGSSFWPTYLSFILIAIFGMSFLKKITLGRVVTASIVASVSFFLITNFFVWYGGSMYPPTWQGLVACYVAGLAFYQPTLFGSAFFNTAMGDLFYTTILFGSYFVLQRSIPKLQLA
ncbi:MAG: DUF6580 family putative transport protein [Runella sp.]